MQNDIKQLTILRTFSFAFIVGVHPRGITGLINFKIKLLQMSNHHNQQQRSLLQALLISTFPYFLEKEDPLPYIECKMMQ
jgi:hypothetical protein